ncbi:MAG: hypothetical protein PHE47_04415 [Oscillospiraceae bacterium]|nr:hypothetical protein [Oscillospiraceae bacterium]
MATGNQAYDLSRYEPKVAEQPKVRVVKRAQPVKSVYGVRPITLVLVAMIVVSITALLLYNNAMIAEISADITSATAQLEQLQNENGRLNRELDAKMSNETIAEIAVNELGLNKLENYQVAYVNLSSQDVVTAKNSGGTGIFVVIGQVITKIQEYLKF